MNSDGNPIRLDDNINMNSNPEKASFRLYHQRTNSSSDEESDLTFYSITNNHYSSTSMTEMEITSLTSSTIDSSLSNETVIISNRNKQ